MYSITLLKQLQEVLVYVFNNTSETAAGGTGLCIQIHFVSILYVKIKVQLFR